MGQFTYVGNSEPAISEVLQDPIIHLIMSRDGLGVDDVRAVIARARDNLSTASFRTGNSAGADDTM